MQPPTLDVFDIIGKYVKLIDNLALLTEADDFTRENGKRKGIRIQKG